MANLMSLRLIGTGLKRVSLRSFMPALTSARMNSGKSSAEPGNQEEDVVTHTGQVFARDDARRSRYLDCDKYVNPNFAIDLIKQQPVVVCAQRVVVSEDKGPLGHPRVYINLDKPGYHSCLYSGRRFVLKKYYDEKAMGPSITYEQYLREVGLEDDS